MENQGWKDIESSSILKRQKIDIEHTRSTV